MIRSFAFLTVALSALISLGCGAKIKHEQQSEVESGETKTFFADAPSENHKVKVEVTSDQPVNVFVFMSSDIKKDDPDSMNDPKKAIGKSEKTNSASLDVTIPRKEEFTVAVTTTGKKAKFTLKMNSQ